MVDWIVNNYLWSNQALAFSHQKVPALISHYLIPKSIKERQVFMFHKSIPQPSHIKSVRFYVPQFVVKKDWIFVRFRDEPSGTLIPENKMWLWGHLNFLKFFWNWVSTSVAYTRVLPWMITVIWAWCPFSKFWPENRIRSFFAWKWSWLHTKCDFEVTSIFFNFFSKLTFRHVTNQRLLPWISMWFWTEFQFSQFWTENQICSFFAWKGSVLHTKCDFEVTSIFWNFFSKLTFRHLTNQRLLPWISMWFWTEFQFSQFWTENQICSFFVWKGSVLHTKCDFEVTSIFLIFSWNSHFAVRHHTRVLPWISMWFCTEFQFSQFWPKTRICSFFASKRSWLHTECDFEVTSIFWNFFEIFLKLSFNIRRIHKGTALDDHCDLGLMSIF